MRKHAFLDNGAVVRFESITEAQWHEYIKIYSSIVDVEDVELDIEVGWTLTDGVWAVGGVSQSISLIDIVKSTINKAILFGQTLVVEFAAENVLLGITQAGLTGQVRDATSKVVSALATGSLYDAIAEAKLIPADKKDAIFITDARLLAFINKIETYLGIPLSETL